MSSDNSQNWTRLLGSSQNDFGSAITTGSDGSIYIAGSTEGDLDGQSHNGGYSDAFISKFNPDGTKDWTRLLGGTYSDSGIALTTGSDGSIYIAGNTTGDLDGQSHNGGYSDAFISKFNPDGTKDWTRLLGSSQNEFGKALTTGSDGSIYIAGETKGDLDDQTNSGENDAFISKFNPDGTKDWTRLLGSSQYDYVGYDSAITTGSDGSIYIAGNTTGNLDGQTNSGGNDAFISKYNPDGTKDWTRLLSSSSSDSGRGLTTGLDGSIYFVNGNSINKFNPNGTKESTSLLNASSTRTLTTGSDGSIYITGYTDGDLDGQTNSGGNDAFISKYNSDGTIDWTRLLGSSQNDVGSALTTGSDGSIYITGSTEGDLDGQTNSGGNDAFIIRITNLSAPKDISLSSSNFNENIDSGSVISQLSTTDADTSDSHSYELVSGDDDTDNAAFTIEGSELKINSSPDYERQSSYSIRLKTTDSGGLSYEEALTINVNNLVDANPTDIELSSTSFIENIDASSLIGLLSTTDTDTFDSHSYEFVSGDGDSDNAAFTIEGSELKINSSPDYKTQSSYSVRIKTTDSDGLSYEEAVTLSVIQKTYSLSTSINVPQEEYTLTTTASTENVAEGSILYWSLSGTNISLADFSDGALTGSGTVGSDGTFSFKHSIANDGETEGYETIDIKLFSDSGRTTQVGETESILIRDSAIEAKIAEIVEDVNGVKQVVSQLVRGQNYTLSHIRDYDGNLHANTGSVSDATKSAYKYQHALDVNGDGTLEAIFTNMESGRWVTASINSLTGKVDYSDYGKNGTTRIVGIYEDPLISEGNSNNGFLSDGVTPAPANFGVSDDDRYVQVNGETIDRLALNSQVRFQNDLKIDNLIAKKSSDFDSDGISEVYWKTNDGTAYLRALMHTDGNIRYANYQNETQMRDYLTTNGFSESSINEIIS